MTGIGKNFLSLKTVNNLMEETNMFRSRKTQKMVAAAIAALLVIAMLAGLISAIV